MTEKKKSRHPWRENIEALTMAVVVALLFKSFILEISKIPSGSMQPTLMGNPETRVFDRVLVDKLSMHLRDPRRFEIVVFKHPLERSRIMVKRLVGMPGEDLLVAGGDLWTRPDASEPWTILRRPRAVQEEMWRRLDEKKPSRSSWSVVEGSGWLVDGRDVVTRGDGTVRFRPEQGHVRDAYLDGYPDALRGDIRVRNPQWGTNAVGDLRLEGQLRADPSVSEVRLFLTEGSRTYEFTLPGPAGAAAAPSIRVLDAAAEPRRGSGDTIEPTGAAPVVSSVSADGWRVPSDRWVDFAAENLDDRLSLEIEGEVVATLDVDRAERQEATASISVVGGTAELEDLMVYRDIYYLGQRDRTWEVSIPEGHYVMLGDNTQDSADSRDWEVVTFGYGEGDTELDVRGNFRKGGENPSWGERDGETLTRFRDEWGEFHWFPRAEGRQGFQIPAPLVPRELIQGRAVAVFWPIKPHKGLIRLAWLH